MMIRLRDLVLNPPAAGAADGVEVLDGCDEVGVLLVEDEVGEADDEVFVASADLAELTSVTAPKAPERKALRPLLADD